MLESPANLDGTDIYVLEEYRESPGRRQRLLFVQYDYCRFRCANISIAYSSMNHEHVEQVQVHSQAARHRFLMIFEPLSRDARNTFLGHLLAA